MVITQYGVITIFCICGVRMLNLPNYDDDFHTLRSHVRLLHGIYVYDLKDMPEIIKCHDEDHEFNFGAYRIQHTHQNDGVTDDSGVDAPPEVDEWSW